VPVPQPTGQGITLPLRLNAGGDEYTDALGTKWQMDAYFNGGATYADGRFDISGTEDDPI
jgi:hypothetical protein